MSLDAYRLATYNVENFYLLLDREYPVEQFHTLTNDQVQDMNSSIYNPNKPLDKIASIAATIRTYDPDLIGLVEVGGMETLKNFNRYYLDNAYDCYLHEENSRRGIFVGALLKKGRFRRVRARNVGGAFSRNLLELRLELGGREFSVYVLHLKSHYGATNGIDVRAAEVAQLCQLLPRQNCVVMGDFNGILIPGSAQFEFEPFLQLPFRDVLEAMGVPEEDRATHFYFTPQPHHNQLDYIFCSNDVQILDGGRLVDFIPNTYDERLWLASDHLCLTARIRPGGVRATQAARRGDLPVAPATDTPPTSARSKRRGLRFPKTTS